MPTQDHRPRPHRHPTVGAATGALVALWLSAASVPAGAALPTLRDAASNLLATGWYQSQPAAFNPKVAVFSFDTLQAAARAVVTASRAIALTSTSSASSHSLAKAPLPTVRAT